MESAPEKIQREKETEVWHFIGLAQARYLQYLHFVL